MEHLCSDGIVTSANHSFPLRLNGGRKLGAGAVFNVFIVISTNHNSDCTNVGGGL